MSFTDLGPRICIIGPSCSGKSTLAVTLGCELGFPVTHLDQLAHYPGTNWQKRPNGELTVAQAEVLNQETWIIEGNYSVCMPERFARATGVIFLDKPIALCLWRYVWRCLKRDIGRPGRLTGATREFNWFLIEYTLRQYPQNRVKYYDLLAKNGHLRVKIIK